MSAEDHTVSFSFEINLEPAMENLRQYQTLLYQTMALARRFGLPEDIDSAISKMQRMIMIANQLRLTIIALEAASGPVGWALAGVGLLTTAVTTGEFIGDVIYDVDRGYMRS